MLDALNQDYVRTARAKGLKSYRVVTFHALRNALIPIVTIIGLQIGGLLSGAFIIESVFAYPGVGQLAVNCAAGAGLSLDSGHRPAGGRHLCRGESARRPGLRILDPRIQYS